MGLNQYKIKIIKQIKEILKSKSSPEYIAMGFSLGTLIAILPTPGFGIFIALFISLLFKRINKLGILVSFTVWNPVLVAPLYWLSYELGDSFFTPNPSIHFDLALFDQLYHYSGKFIFGNALIAMLLSCLSYFAVYLITQRHLRKKGIEGILDVQRQERKKSS
jgi:uncharacterized protein